MNFEFQILLSFFYNEQITWLLNEPLVKNLYVFFALTHTHCTHCGFFFFSHNILLFTVLTLRHHLFSIIHFTTWIKASQFFLDLCALQKLCIENSNLVFLFMGYLLSKNLIFLFWFHAQFYYFSPLLIGEDHWAKTIKFFATLSIY